MVFVMLVERLVIFDRELWSCGPYNCLRGPLHEMFEKHLFFSENSDFNVHLQKVDEMFSFFVTDVTHY